MGNLTWEKVTKDLYTAVLVLAGCNILGNIFDVLDTFEVPFVGILATILYLCAAAATVWFCILLGQWQKVADANAQIGEESFINGKYILAQKGKKNYFIIKVA
jgi:hypothetical protein